MSPNDNPERQRINRNPRLNGAVKRYHVWPTLQQQTVADHVYHVLRIYWEMWGPPEPRVLTHILWHDTELQSGDVPFGAKYRDQLLKARHEAAELSARKDIAGARAIVEISDLERCQFKIADLLEMWEFGVHEAALGNTLMQPVIDDCIAAACAEAERHMLQGKVLEWTNNNLTLWGLL